MPSDADIALLLSVDTTDYERGLNKAKERLPSFEAAMERSMKRAGGMERSINQAGQAAQKTSMGGYNQLGRATLELSRGAEDFMAVYGTQGMTGAIRASSNNLSQFASIIHPMAGAVTGFSLAIGAALLPSLFDTKKGADDTTKSMDKLREAITAAREEAARGFEIQDTIKEGPDAIESEADKLKRREAEIEAGIEAVEAQRRKLLAEEGEIQKRFNAATGQTTNQRVLPGESTAPTGIRAFMRDVGFYATNGLIDSTKNVALRESQGAAAKDRAMQEEILKLDRERLKLAKEREELERNLGKARIEATNAEHAAMRARDIEQAREEEAEMKREDERAREAADRQAKQKQKDAEKLAEKQRKLEQDIADDISPEKGRERAIVQELRDRRRAIEELFGGDANLTQQAEQAARGKLEGLQKQSAPTFAGSPAALERGSSAAVGLINRVRNQSVKIEEKQLAEQKLTNSKIDALIDSARHPPDLPPSEFN